MALTFKIKMKIQKKHAMEKVTNPYSNQIAIFYYEYLATLEDKKVGFDGHSKLWDKVRKGIDWFQTK
jgi:hypothetical protein